MRINELLESVDIDLDRNKQNSKDNELDFDLVEDLAFFLNNDDDTYRRNTYPSIHKCISRIQSKQKTHPSIFKIGVLKGYKDYLNKYGRRELPDVLDEKVCEEVCKKMHEETCKHVEEGKYKD